jgi:4-hydroxythreonine-4-phosphate dehydrogenase
MSTFPPIAATIGDPCGIGPEVVIKALASGAVPAPVLLIGDAEVVRRTIALTGAHLTVRAVQSFEAAQFAPGTVDVLDPGGLEARDITPGKVSPACGRATIRWWEIATELAEAKKVPAIVKGPTNGEAIRLATGDQAGDQARAAPAGKTFLFLITGPLRVVHLTDHITMREMLDHVRMHNVLELLRLTHASLRRWGIREPHIGVAGLNPHCYGPEDEQEIAPAVRQAQAEGIRASGPVAADSLFRLCTEGQYDCALAHYHDQGHIAVKTWRFSGNCAISLGYEPYIRMSVAHGTAFDIAGKGIADPLALTAALRTSAMLSAGKGFPKEG